MSMISINDHDWSGVEEWFERRAAAAGHSKYEHSEIIPLPSGDSYLVGIIRRMAANLVESMDQALIDANSKP
jgi:hypothetical protein